VAFVLACSVAAAQESVPPAPDAHEVTVFAAASLNEVFEEIGERFREQHPDTKVTFNFAGSQQLAAQIAEGAPANVFASANQEQMKRVADAKLAHGEPRVFATNTLAICVERKNPKNVRSLADLARKDVVVVLAAEEVPAGKYAREALKKAGVNVSAASSEIDVRAVLSKVMLGEADAGIVYRSDIKAARYAVEEVAIPTSENVVATYPIVSLVRTDSKTRETRAADDFVELVLSAQGREILAAAGFSLP